MSVKQMGIAALILDKYTAIEKSTLKVDDEILIDFQVPTGFLEYKNLFSDAAKVSADLPDPELMYYVYLLSFVVKNLELDDIEQIARKAPTIFTKMVEHFETVLMDPMKYVTIEELNKAEKKSKGTPGTKSA